MGKTAKAVVSTIKRNPVRNLLGPFLWAALVAFLLSPGILFNIPAGTGMGLMGNGNLADANFGLFDGEPFSADSPIPANKVSALVHAFVIAMLILPGQLLALTS